MTLRRALRAQFDAAAVLAAALVVPGTEAIARRVRTPRLTEEVLAGVPTTVVRPSSKPPWPAIVFANGATKEGRTHPLVRRLAWGFGWAGYLTYVPDLPGVALGELTPTSLEAAVGLVGEAARAPEARGRVALTGISTGGTLCLLAASDPLVADRVSAVAVVAPFTDLEKVIVLATTGRYPGGDGLAAYTPPPYLLVALCRSLAATLPESDPHAALCARLRALDGSAPDPLQAFRLPDGELGSGGVALRALLSNRDPERVGELLAGLPEPTRDAVRLLSPVRTVERLRAPAEVLTAPRDSYFPIDEAYALTRASPRVRVTVTNLLGHATPKLSPRKLKGLAAMDGFIVRALAAARE